MAKKKLKAECPSSFYKKIDKKSKEELAPIIDKLCDKKHRGDNCIECWKAHHTIIYRNRQEG